MTLTGFSLAVLLTVVVSVFIETYRGINRGIKKTAVSTATIILSVIVSSVLSTIISRLFSDLIASNITNNPFFVETQAQFPNIDQLVSAYIAALIAPFLFLILFFVVRLIFAFIVACFYKTALKKKPDDPEYSSSDIPWYQKHPKAICCTLGIISGLIISIVITAPLIGSINIVNDTVDLIDKNQSFISDSEIDTTELISIKKYSSELPTKITYSFGGKILYNSLTYVSLDGQNLPISKEIENIDKTVTLLRNTLEIIQHIESVSPQKIEEVNSMLKDLKKSPSFNLLASDFLSQASSAWLAGDSYMNISSFSTGGIIDPLISEILYVCTKTTQETVVDDLSTILQIFLVATKNNMLDSADFNNIIEKLNSDNLIDQFCEPLLNNPRMAYIADGVWEITVNAFAFVIKNYNYSGDQRDMFMSMIADHLTQAQSYKYEQRIEMVSESLHENVASLGIELPKNISDIIAEAMINEINGSKGIISPQHVENFFNSHT